jgi:transposase InsO family protein
MVEFGIADPALGAVDEAVLLYNTKRPHTALKFETPENTHRMVA